MADSHDDHRRAGPKRPAGPGDALFLAERAVRRWAGYYRELADLTKEGSAEPRLWIGSVENLWRGLAEDYGDYLRRLRGEDAPAGREPARAPTSAFRFVDITEDRRVHEMAFEVPDAFFASEAVAKVGLSTDGMWRNGDRILRPGTHLSFSPGVVDRHARATKLRFHDLPASLHAGMTPVGTIIGHPVHADGGKQPAGLVTVVQLRIA